MAIDFRLTASQRDLQLRSRKFAKEVLFPAIEAEYLPTPEERFAATKRRISLRIHKHRMTWTWHCSRSPKE